MFCKGCKTKGGGKYDDWAGSWQGGKGKYIDSDGWGGSWGGSWDPMGGYMGGKGMMPWGMMGMMPWGMPSMASMKGSKDFPKGNGKGSSTSKKVFVGGLPKVPSEDSIRDYFSKFGPIVEVRMMHNPSGESKGYCFVTFESAESAKQVFDNYDSNIIDDKWVDCKPSDGGKSGKPGDWMCPMCGDLVFAWRNACNMCGFGGMPTMPSTTSGGKAGDWLCPSTPSGGKAGDWICQHCGDLVFSYRDRCNRCGAPKEQAAQRIGARKGDWTCPSCGDLVFASKAACTLCSTPKPADADRNAGSYEAFGGKSRPALSSPY